MMPAALPPLSPPEHQQQQQGLTAAVAAALSPALAAVLRPDHHWLQQIQSPLGALRDVEAAAALCSDIGTVLYNVAPAVDDGSSMDATSAVVWSSSLAAVAAPRAGPAAAVHAVDAAINNSTMTNHLECRGISPNEDTGADINAGARVRAAASASAGASAGASAMTSNRASNGGCGGDPDLVEGVARAEAAWELPRCIPREVFRGLFRECRDSVMAERTRGSAAVSIAAAPAADTPLTELHSQQQQQRSRRRQRGSPTVSPAMGVASDSPMRRRFRSSSWVNRDLQQPSESEGEDMEWSADALELLHRAAEAMLVEVLQEGRCGGDGGEGCAC